MNQNSMATTLGRLMISLVAFSTAVRAETELPRYVPATDLAGIITSVGSDTMVYLVSFWAVEFKKLYPRGPGADHPGRFGNRATGASQWRVEYWPHESTDE